MKIGFIVGEIEQHQMELSLDQRTGDLRILLDGTQVLQDSSTLATEPIKRYELNIGEQERLKLALQLTFEDEQNGASQHDQNEATPYQLSFADQVRQRECEECNDWPIFATPRVSLMVSAASA